MYGKNVGSPGGSDICLQCRKLRFNPWGGKDSLERGYPLKYPCLEHFIDRAAWQAIVQWWVTMRHDWVTKHSTELHYHSKGSMKDSKDRTLGLEGWATGWENQVTGQEGRAARHTIPRPGSLVDLSAAIWNRLELVTPLCLSFLLLKQKCLNRSIHHCISRIHNLFSSFMGPEKERILPPRWIISRVSLIPTLDGLDAEIWDF